ncbi:acyl carrier protein [Streptomyces sp. B3I7]|uniref:phosphopantetheine-binding protein n=1 Tax=unclassified Streptomyces TaxID=2593676 RepID=UPI00277F99F0|nr:MULTISPECIES: phosphopantetheine-binding protein [unclassified Streptomyces]MDQ0789991.1 acyl carrier protein [Streptomyces sp. B3I8]MDQ0810403.1 acyl carrier protein [Streptomyces sp. B3I7]
MPDTYDTVRSVLTDTFRVPGTDIEPGRTLGQLDLDSLALAELALVLHERLGVRIDGEYASRDTTVDRLAGHLASLCAGGSGAVASS